MLLTHCPNCGHDNIPGERFCAACGVPLNLKPCPQCGKVDQLTAKVCSGCGAAFPPIAGAHVPDGTARPAAQGVTEPAPSVEPSRPQSQGAWPLILMAIVAGGIPLLWMNRAYIPLPKAWQVKGPNAAGSAAAPAAVPAEPPAIVPIAAPTVPSEAAAPPAAPAQPAAALAAETPEPPAPQPAAEAATKPVAPPAVHARTHRSPAVKAAPARPCTEALAAMGLCQPGSQPK